MTRDLATITPSQPSSLVLADGIVPAIIEKAGAKARRRWVEFFAAELTNDNTRAAYALAPAEFFAWLERVVGNVTMIGNRRHVELREKGCKHHVMPCHHELEDYLLAYMRGAGIEQQPATPLFRAVTIADGRRTLGPSALTRNKAWEMVQRRATAAGITTAACNHTFRATGITTFLENGGAIEKARDMAAHASIKTTQLYDRRSKAVKIDDVVLINLRARKGE